MRKAMFHQIAVRLPEEIYNGVKAESEKSKEDITQTVRKIVTDGLFRRQLKDEVRTTITEVADDIRKLKSDIAHIFEKNDLKKEKRRLGRFIQKKFNALDQNFFDLKILLQTMREGVLEGLEGIKNIAAGVANRQEKFSMALYKLIDAIDELKTEVERKQGT